MRDQKFRHTRGKDGKSTGYQDGDRIGLGSKANDFEPIFIEYSAPMMSKNQRKQMAAETEQIKAHVQSQPSLGGQGSTASTTQAARQSASVSKLNMMRNAYKSQYGRHFTAATHTVKGFLRDSGIVTLVTHFKYRGY